MTPNLPENGNLPEDGHLPENGHVPENSRGPENSRQSKKIHRRTLRTAGALLVGFALSSCAQPADHAGARLDSTRLDDTAPQAQNQQAPAQPAENSAASTSAQAPRQRVEDTDRSARARTEPEAPRTDRCHTSQLDGSLNATDHGAGQRYADLTLRNHSGETCVLYGYGGLRLTDENDRPLPTDLHRTSDPGPAMVRLAPGDTASTSLHWSIVPHDDEPTDGQCQPTPASAQVTPPDETDSLPVAWDLGFVCGSGSIDGSAYH